MLSRIKSIFGRNTIAAILPQAIADSRETHRREVARLIMRERSSIRTRTNQLDKHIAAATASLAELKDERDQLEAQYAGLALDLSRYGAPSLAMTIPAGGDGDHKGKAAQ